MSNNEILKMIADFMQLETVLINEKWRWESKHDGVHELRYDSSYDWLMPVWFKFRNLGIEIKGVTYKQNFRQISESFKNGITSSDIKGAYNDAAMAIKWYNMYNAEIRNGQPIK